MAKYINYEDLVKNATVKGRELKLEECDYDKSKDAIREFWDELTAKLFKGLLEDDNEKEDDENERERDNRKGKENHKK